MRGSRKTYCLSQEVLFYFCHESPKLKSNCAFIKLREIKKQYSRTGGGEFIQKGEFCGAQVPTSQVGLTQNAHEELVSSQLPQPTCS